MQPVATHENKIIRRARLTGSNKLQLATHAAQVCMSRRAQVRCFDGRGRRRWYAGTYNPPSQGEDKGVVDFDDGDRLQLSPDEQLERGDLRWLAPAAAAEQGPQPTNTGSADRSRSTKKSTTAGPAKPTAAQLRSILPRLSLAVLERGDRHVRGASDDALVIELMAVFLTFSCFSYLRGSAPEPVPSIARNAMLLLLDNEPLETYDRVNELLVKWSALEESRANACVAFVVCAMREFLDLKQVVAMLKGTHPVGQALERGDLAAAYAELCRLNNDPDARPYPERTFIRTGRFTVQPFDRAAKGLLEQFAQSPYLPTGLSPEEFKTALLGAPGGSGLLRGFNGALLAVVALRAAESRSLFDGSLTLADGGPGTRAFCEEFGCSVSGMLEMLRAVEWAPKVEPHVAAWVAKYPSDAKYAADVRALAARRHNDVDLENFCCEAKRHCTIFAGRGKKRSLDSVPGHEQDLALKKRIIDAALGRT